MRAEIQYGAIHSDLPDDDRQALHRALDEYLNNASEDGFFYVGNNVELSEHLND